MRIGFLALCLYWLSSSAVHASTLIDLGSSSCSESLSFDSSDGLILNCTGDFSLSSGTLSSDTSISLLSLRSLTLDGFTLSAPNIMLKSGSIYINSNVSLIGSFIDLSANRIMYGDQPLEGSPIPISSDSDIIKPLLSPDSNGSITLNSGGNISLDSGTNLTRIKEADITIDRSRGWVLLAPRIIEPIELVMTSETIMSRGSIAITSVPLPSSFVALLTGLLILVSVSGRSFSSKGQS
ncbi:hypothetical protein [Methylobacter sp.]|uniref:hypothetical protein n=1 Tax=Methylobacter sp. TaxID=2051955 RepID=UPI00121125FE|nr:hypothetical protein [Methylobacter sp.]TAK63171.1 MAG: hypothetical protein EPO18_07610 [Methylobacter sp.]